MIKKAYKCPGPGYGHRCVDRGVGTPRGGRCKACRLQAMRFWTQVTRSKKPTLSKHGGRRLASEAAKSAAKREQEEIQRARAVKADDIGVKGGLRIINDWLKQ